jgi:uncharacterized protein YkwD
MTQRKGIARAVAAVVLAGGVLAAAPAPAATPAAPTYASQIVGVVNNIRADHNLPRLKRNACLQRFAVKQAKAMAAQGRLFHQDLGKIQKACKLGWVGENVAYGPGSASQLVQQWMNSPPHRANILFKKFKATGVGASKAQGYWWASQVFGGK